MGRLALVRSPTDPIQAGLAGTSIMCQETQLTSKTPEKGKYLPADSRTSALDNLSLFAHTLRAQEARIPLATKVGTCDICFQRLTPRV